jgi:hypothetical protein
MDAVVVHQVAPPQALWPRAFVVYKNKHMPRFGAIQERSRLIDIEEEIDVRLVLVLVDWWAPNSHATNLFVAPVLI